MTRSPADIIRERLQDVPTRWLDISTVLRHFALITYALPAERLRPHVPERFEIVEFDLEGEKRALLSAVPFWDENFSFVCLPFLRFSFGQVNHRIYVRDRETGENAVWFLGTTLGSGLVRPARALWRIPWHTSRHHENCDYDSESRHYREWRMDVDSSWCSARIELRDTGEAMRLMPGFQSMDELVLILTHPVNGFFYRTDGKVGTYSVRHDIMNLTMAEPVDLHFSLYERLGLLTASEMLKPHSILLCPEIRFAIQMPPRVLG